MKKIILLITLAVGLSIASCSKDKENIEPVIPVVPTPDPVVPTPELAMPFIINDYKAVKDSLNKIATDLVEVKKDGCSKVTCHPAKTETNMFESLSYEFNNDANQGSEIVFTYTLFPEYKDKANSITAYLNQSFIKL